MRRIGRWGRWAVFGVVGLMLVCVASAFALTAINWNFARPWLTRQVSQAIGRDLEMRGDLSLSWRWRPAGAAEAGSQRLGLPVLHVTARDLQVSNPTWARSAQFASLGAMELDLALPPLLLHRIEILSLNLIQPQLDLERSVDGRDNWSFPLPSAGAKPDWVVDLGILAFPTGAISYSDAREHTQLQLSVNTLAQTIPFADALAEIHALAGHAPVAASATAAQAVPPPVQPYAMSLAVRGLYQGQAVNGQAKLGSVLFANDPHRPFPIQGDVHFGATHITLTGTLIDPARLAALDVRLGLSGASAANLYVLTGINLPDTSAFAIDGRLVGTLKPGAISLSYDNFKGRVGGSDLHGTLLFQQGDPRPRLSGSLQSNVLQFSDLAPLVGADSNASKASRGDTFRQPDNKVIPAEPFHTDRWKAIDVDVNFVGRKIVRSADLPIQNLSTHLIMNAGVLTLDPLQFGVAGGTLDSTLRLVGSVEPLKAQLKLAVRHLKLKQLFPSYATKQSNFGEINGDTALSGTGNSFAALAGASNGELKLVITDGTISSTLLEEAGLNVGNVVVDKLFGNKDVKINCAASDFIATDGVLDTRFFALDTEDALITTTGSINLQTEQMNLTVRPQTKGVRILSLRSPLYVKGSFKQPDVGVDKLALALRGGAVLGLALLAPPAAIVPLLSPSHNENLPCAKIIGQMNAVPIAPPAGQHQKPQAPLDVTPGGPANRVSHAK